MWLERISGGDIDLLDADDAKAHLRIIGDEFDTEIETVIRAASAFLDVDIDGFGGLGFPLISQQWEAVGRGFYDSVLRLPFTRIRSVDQISYLDLDGNQQIISVDNYEVGGSGRSRQVFLTSGSSWPSVYSSPQAVRVRFTAGFVDAESVPEDIKAAARLLIGHFFENRLAASSERVTKEIELGVECLVGRYRRFAS